MMPYVVHIHDNQTGLTTTRKFEFDWDPDTSSYWWKEGNMSCDCNRHLEFLRGMGEDPELDDERIKCNSVKNRFTVFSIIDPRGEEVYSETLLEDE